MCVLLLCISQLFHRALIGLFRLLTTRADAEETAETEKKTESGGGASQSKRCHCTQKRKQLLDRGEAVFC